MRLRKEVKVQRIRSEQKYRMADVNRQHSLHHFICNRPKSARFKSKYLYDQELVSSTFRPSLVAINN